MGLDIGLGEAECPAIGKAVSIGADIAVSFFRLSLW